MAYLKIAEAAVPSTPGAGSVTLYSDNSANPTVRQVDDNGKNVSLFNIYNQSIVSQAPAAATRVYIAGSALAVPKNKLQVGTQMRWTFSITKTGAGTAASTIDVAVGTTGTTADTARLSFTKPAGTAVIDEGTITINATVRAIGATGNMVGQFNMIHNLAATGHMVIPCACVNNVSGNFDMTVADLIVGVCITSGAADAITIQLVQSEMWLV